MAILTKQLPEWKTKAIDELVKRMLDSKTVAVVDIKGLPGKQFHSLRSKLRKDMNITVIRKTVIKYAIDKAKEQKKNLGELNEHLGEMPAIVLSQKNPFQLSKLFMENKAPAFAKAGDIAPEDISVDEGPTPFTPGPMISELSSVGLKVKVDAGKIVVMQKSTIAHAGEPIKAEVAEILVKLGVQPMEVGLDLASAWEGEFVYKKDILRFDVNEYLNNFTTAANQAFSLSIGIAYPTKDNISLLVSKAYNEAKVLALEQDIFVDALVPQLMAKANAQAAGLNTYVEENKPAEAAPVEAPKEETPVQAPAETPAEEKKEETPAETPTNNQVKGE